MHQPMPCGMTIYAGGKTFDAAQDRGTEKANLHNVPKTAILQETKP